MYQFLLDNAKDFSLLYVEDNDGLREKAERFFKKFFTEIYVGTNGEEGLLLYEKHKPDIVVTDIRMPKLDGMQMSKKIKSITDDVKIIVTSAFDDKEYLMKSIEVGIYRYVNKPFNIEEITQVLTECITELQNREKIEIFNNNIKDIFNHQDNLLVFLENNIPTIANYNFLKFFNINKIEELLEKNKTLSGYFLEQDNFLYGNNIYDEIKNNINSLYNVKMQKDGKFHHFILKVKSIPEKENCIIFSFSDVTELNLLGKFKENTPISSSKLIELLHTVKNNKSKVKIHNFYKGLSITNEAEILDINKDFIKVKTTYVQQMAVQNQKFFFLSSKIMPKDIFCEEIVNINRNEQTITAKQYSFQNYTPLSRKYVRVQPDKNHKAGFLYNDVRFNGEIKDLSIKAVRIRIPSSSDTMRVDRRLKVDIVLQNHEQKLFINCDSKIARIDEHAKYTDIIFLLDISDDIIKTLTEYISNRQLELIREFKHVDRETVDERKKLS
ncbi:response regulator [Sulfurospirillum arcachonense]|uniref:response regulator n=1 Tax=Sulfurospirillum arcachonense TaxID=57666 RepID=UPI00046A789D|nr:response regulator [Sulfurospirillum arcachonense]